MGELLTLGIVVLAFYLVIRFGSRALAAVFGSQYYAYRQLAQRRNGRCEARGLVDPPTVTFNHNGSLVRVGLAPMVAGQRASPRTRVVVRFSQGLPLRFELFPASRPAPAQPPRGTRAVQLDNPEFDRVYVLQANDADIAREVLAPDSIRLSLETLRKLCPPSGVLISVSPERLLTQIDRNLGTNVGELDRAVRETLQIHDWLLASVARRIKDGVAVVAVGPASADADAEEPECEVCGDAIVGAHVTCNRCQTPCHRDCWSFVGACSTFGCGGKACSPVAANKSRPAGT